MTETYLGVANGLEGQHGVRVTWFSFSRVWSKWLIRSGVSPENLVTLDGGTSEFPERASSIFPHPDGDGPSVLEAISGDRILGHRPLKSSDQWLGGMARKMQHEIATRGIGVIFGESTWAAEIVAGYASRSVGASYLSPGSVRYPVERFGFFKAPMQAELLPLEPNEENLDDIAVSTLEAVQAVRAPRLWSANEFTARTYSRMPRLMLEKARLSVTDARGNPTQRTVREYIDHKNPLSLRKWTSLAEDVMAGALHEPPLGKPFVLNPLQVQPEASTDVLAWHASDQLLTAKRLAGHLDKMGLLLAVKEHSHFFGSRDPRFYAEINRIPNAFLVAPSADSRLWAQAAAGVVTPTGTMSFENALRGGRSFILSDMYFATLPSIRLLDSRVPELWDLDPFGIEVATTHQKLALLAEISARSACGQISNPRSSPSVLDPTNLNLLVAGFCRALRSIDEGWQARLNP